MNVRVRLLGLLVPCAFVAKPRLPVERLTLGSLSLSLGVTSFDQVASRLGASPIAHTGDAGESRYQACYVSPGAHRATYYIESDEMGSGERVTQVEAIAPGARAAAEDSLLAGECPPLATPIHVRTDRGIELGLSRQDVERRMGGRGRDSSGVIIYSGSETRRVKDSPMTAWSFLRLRYRAGRLVAFAAAAGLTD